MTTRQKFARWLMRRCTNVVARIDHKAVPKVSPWAFTFERGRGAVINETGCSSERRGAMLLYIDDYDYERAFSDSETCAADRCCAGGPQWGHAWDCPKCPG